MPAAEAGPLLRGLRRCGDALARVPRPLGALLALAWAAMIWHLSGGPAPAVPPTPPFVFLLNFAHAPLFGVLALFCALVLPRAAPGGWPALSLPARAGVVLFVLAYAVADEWHQSRTPGRSSTWHDVVTDVAGAAATLFAAAYLARADAGGAGLARRLALGLCACAAAAALAAFG
jgi:hypothetical protein